MFIFRLIKKVLKWIKDHTIGVLIAAFGFMLSTVSIGLFNKHKAKKINARALAIQNEALKLHDREYQETQLALAELGHMEKMAVDAFPRFADALEQIQGRPLIKVNPFSSFKIPRYEPNEIRTLSSNIQMALAGAGGTGMGTLAGLAAFGSGAIIAAPAMIAGGIVICVKGIGLKNKAIENERQAKEMKKSVEEIVGFYSRLRKETNSFCSSVSSVYQKYVESIQIIENILITKNEWDIFTKYEKKVVENSILLTGLLCSMIKTNIIVQTGESNKIESINTVELTKLKKQAVKLLDEAA